MKELKIALSCGSYETSVNMWVDTDSQAAEAIKAFFDGTNEHFRDSAKASERFLNNNSSTQK